MSQVWDPARYADEAGFVAAGGAALLDLLGPLEGLRVLDLGCGDGTLTAELVGRGASVVGVDSSPEMVAAARARGLDARVADAQDLRVDETFDAVLSNAALHWMPDQPAVLRGVRALLAPGGRLVAELAGQGNIAAVGVAVNAALRLHGVAPTTPNPWHPLGPETCRGLLTDTGFAVEALWHFPRPTPLPHGLRGWLDVFGGPLLSGLADAERDEVVATAESLSAPWLRDPSGAWTADYVRLRFVATAR